MSILSVNFGDVADYYRSKARMFLALSTPVMAFKMAVDNITDIRDELVEFSRFKQLKFTEKLRAATNDHHDMIRTKFPLYQMTNGIVGSTYLRYAAAKDMRGINPPPKGKWHYLKKLNPFYKESNKNTVSIFFSPESEGLATEINEAGYNAFVNNDARYHVGTVPYPSTQNDITGEIYTHIKHFSDFGTNVMTASGGDFSELSIRKDSIGRSINQKIYGYSNDLLCITIRQNKGEDGGGWTLKISEPVNNEGDKKQYTPFDNINPQMKWIKALLSNGAPDETFKKKGDALAYMDVLWEAALQLAWQHKEPNVTKKAPNQKLVKFLTYGTSNIQKFLNKEWASSDNVKEALFDVGWTVGALVLARYVAKAAIATAFTATLPVTLAGIIAFNFGVRKLKSFLFKTYDKAKLFVQGPRAIFGIGGDYVDPSADNMERIQINNDPNAKVKSIQINTKPNIAMNDHLHVLTGKDKNLSYSDAKQISPVEQQRTLRRLITKPVSGQSKKFSQFDRYTSTTAVFNGLACINHWDPKKEIHTAYYKRIGALDMNEHIELSGREKEALQEGKIIRIVQVDGRKSLNYKEVTFAQMKRQLKSRLFQIHDPKLDEETTPRRTEKAYAHIETLFNYQADVNSAAPEEDTELDKELKTDAEADKERFESFKKIFEHTGIVIKKPTEEAKAFNEQLVLPDASWISRLPA